MRGPISHSPARRIVAGSVALGALALVVGVLAAIWLKPIAEDRVEVVPTDAPTGAIPAPGDEATALYADLGTPLTLPALAVGDQPALAADHPLAQLLDEDTGGHIDPDLESILPRLDDPAQRPLVLAVIGARDQDSAVRHELLSLLRRSGDPELEAVLLTLLGDQRESALIRSYAAQHLAVNLDQDYQPEGVDRRAVLRRALHQDPEPMVRREALLGLARAGDEAVLAMVRAGDDPLLAGMDDLALSIWQEQDWTELAPLVPAYLDHDDDQVVVAAVALIASWRIEAGHDRLAALDGQRGPRVDRAVALALRRLE